MDSFFEGPLVKTRPGDRGENGVLFSAYLAYWAKKNNSSYPMLPGAIEISFDKNRPGYFKANPPEETEHFSVDNMTGLYALSKLFSPETIARLPVFKWNHKEDKEGREKWWHPNGWMVFLSMKSPLWKYSFYPFLLLMAIWSGAREVESTTGRNLWWIRSEMLDLPSLQWAIKKAGDTPKNGMRTFEHSFKYYFTYRFQWKENWDHPIIKEVDKFYLKQSAG